MMTTYRPGNWVVVKLSKGDKTYYKILAGWSGGYLDGSAWRLNSGIKSVNAEGLNFEVNGHSGSVYKCRKTSYGYSTAMNDGLAHLNSIPGVEVEILTKEQAFRDKDWRTSAE